MARASLRGLPLGIYGMVMGLTGLGLAWRTALAPAWASEPLLALGAAVLSPLSMRDVLWAIALVAMAMGWWRYHVRMEDHCDSLYSELFSQSERIGFLETMIQQLSPANDDPISHSSKPE